MAQKQESPKVLRPSGGLEFYPPLNVSSKPPRPVPSPWARTTPAADPKTSSSVTTSSAAQRTSYASLVNSSKKPSSSTNTPPTPTRVMTTSKSASPVVSPPAQTKASPATRPLPSSLSSSNTTPLESSSSTNSYGLNDENSLMWDNENNYGFSRLSVSSVSSTSASSAASSSSSTASSATGRPSTPGSSSFPPSPSSSSSGRSCSPRVLRASPSQLSVPSTSSLSLLMALGTSPNLSSSAATSSSAALVPMTTSFSLGSSRLRESRRKTFSPATKAREPSSSPPLSSPNSLAKTSPLNSALDRPSLVNLKTSPLSMVGLERPPSLGRSLPPCPVPPPNSRSPFRRALSSPRQRMLGSPPSSVSPSLLPATLSRDLSFLLTSPPSSARIPPGTVATKSAARAQHGTLSRTKARLDGWSSKEVDEETFGPGALDPQAEGDDPAVASSSAEETFMRFFPPTPKATPKLGDAHADKLVHNPRDAFGRNTHNLSLRIKMGMDKYLQGTYDPVLNQIVGRGEFNEELTQDITTALAFSTDFSPMAIAYMHLYLREWKEANRLITSLALPGPRTLVFGRSEIHNGIVMTFCERNGEYVVEACDAPPEDDYEVRPHFRIWIKVLFDEPDRLQSHVDPSYLAIKGFALRYCMAALHDVWETSAAFPYMSQSAPMRYDALDDGVGETPSDSDNAESEQYQASWGRAPPSEPGYPDDYPSYPAPTSHHNHSAYTTPKSKALASNKTIVKRYNAAKGDKKEKVGQNHKVAHPNPKPKTGKAAKELVGNHKEMRLGSGSRRPQPQRFAASPGNRGEGSDASGQSTPQSFQPTPQVLPPPHSLPSQDLLDQQARLQLPIVMRNKQPSFSADLESNHNVHQKRSPMNPVTAVVSAHATAHTEEGGGRRHWPYQWRQGEFVPSSHNSHLGHYNQHMQNHPGERANTSSSSRMPPYSYPPQGPYYPV